MRAVHVPAHGEIIVEDIEHRGELREEHDAVPPPLELGKEPVQKLQLAAGLCGHMHRSDLAQCFGGKLFCIIF